MTFPRARNLAGPAAITAAGLAFVVAGPAEARVHRVDVGSNYFSPEKKKVRTGDKVRFVWEKGGIAPHDVTVEKGPKKFRSPLQVGGSWTTKRLRKAGRYTLVCSQHFDMGMTLIVKKR